MFIDYFLIWNTFLLIRLFLIEKLMLPGDATGMELAGVLMDPRDTAHLGFVFITSSQQMSLFSENYEWKQQITVVCVSPTNITAIYRLYRSCCRYLEILFMLITSLQLHHLLVLLLYLVIYCIISICYYLVEPCGVPSGC